MYRSRPAGPKRVSFDRLSVGCKTGERDIDEGDTHHPPEFKHAADMMGNGAVWKEVPPAQQDLEH